MITVIWDTWLKPGAEEEGLRITRQVWGDMRSFSGYVSHEIFIDQDAPGHIIALATWQTRAHADSVREKYKDSDTNETPPQKPTTGANPPEADR
jgi:heme-degrading monooxygenase HmoA